MSDCKELLLNGNEHSKSFRANSQSVLVTCCCLVAVIATIEREPPQTVIHSQVYQATLVRSTTRYHCLGNLLVTYGLQIFSFTAMVPSLTNLAHSCHRVVACRRSKSCERSEDVFSGQAHLFIRSARFTSYASSLPLKALKIIIKNAEPVAQRSPLPEAHRLPFNRCTSKQGLQYLCIRVSCCSPRELLPLGFLKGTELL